LIIVILRLSEAMVSVRAIRCVFPYGGLYRPVDLLFKLLVAKEFCDWSLSES